MSDQIPTDRRDIKRIIFIFIAIYALCSIFVGASGAGLNPFGLNWDFERVGQLGDAFGVLNAGMASLAAAFTLQNLIDERDETKRLRAREAERDAEDRLREARRLADTQRREALEIKRDESAHNQNLELTFFRMMELRRSLLHDIVVGDQSGIYAVRRMSKDFRAKKAASQILSYHNDLLRRFGSLLNQYYRFNYHILKFLDDNFPFSDAYRYVQILRAQLSSSEQLIIAINATIGPGRAKMLPLINKYSLLHTIPDTYRDFLLSYCEGLEPLAFLSPSSVEGGPV